MPMMKKRRKERGRKKIDPRKRDERVRKTDLENENQTENG